MTRRSAVLASSLAVVSGVLFSAALTFSYAQMGGGASPDLDQKLAALKQAAAQNKQNLRHYQWTETRQIVLKGEAKPQQAFQCSYNASGQLQRIPLGAPPQQQQQGGKLRQRIVERKQDEMKDYMQQVQSLLSLYVPPNPTLIQQAIQQKNVSFDKDLGENGVSVVFRNYAKPADQMTIAFNPNTKKISTINVNTYMDSPKDVVTLAVQMATLPDGTSYAQQSVLDATAKQLQVTTINSNYARIQ